MRKILFLMVMFLFVLQVLALAAPVTIIDPAGQSQATVSSERLYVDTEATLTSSNAIVTTERAKKTTYIIGSGLIYNGACRVLSVNLFSGTAGDNIAVYDLVAQPTNMYQLEFEIGISANNSSQSFDAKGTSFVNGIYVYTATATALTSVVFDY